MDAVTASSEPKSGENFLQQYVVTFIATLLLLSSGFSAGWSSPALPLLQDANSPVVVTSDEAAWIVAFLDMGTLIAGIPAVWLMDRFGRRCTLLAGAVPLTASWVLLATARHLATLYVARLLAGLTLGLGLAVVPVYLGEIAAVRLRGRLAAMVMVSYQLGILLAYTIGYAVATQAELAWLALVPVGVFVTAATWALPESPFWSLVNGREAEARSCLQRLCGRSDVSAEWQILGEQLVVSGSAGGSGVAEIVGGPANRRALAIIAGVTCIHVLCGSWTTIAYAETIFARLVTGGEQQTVVVATEEEVSATINVAGLVSIGFGLVQLAAATTSALAMDFAGRRTLLLASVLGTTACNGLVAVFLQLSEVSDAGGWLAHQLEQLAWLPVATVWLGVVFFFVGLATVIFALLAELLPAHLRRLGGAVYTLLSGAMIFTVNKLFQVVADGWGVSVAFWLFAGCGLLFVPFVWCCVPETRGRQLSEIRAELAAGWRGWRWTGGGAVRSGAGKV